MKVILLEDVYKHGVAGEVVKVADGFARNYLIPRKLAAKATPGELKRAENLREQVAVRRAAYENKLNELAHLIDGVELIFGRRAAVTGKLFGSVTTQEIADALNEKTGIDINRRRVSQQPIREVGTHEVPVRLGTEISPVLKITVVREEELADFLAKREAGEIPDDEDEDNVEVEDVATLETEVIPQVLVDEALADIAAQEAEDADEDEAE